MTALAAAPADAPSLRLRLPAGTEVSSAVVTAAPKNVEIPGVVHEPSVFFPSLRADLRYDVRLKLKSGALLQGVDMGWYNDDPARPDAEGLSPEDRDAISQIVQAPSFYNKSEVLLLHGDHTRATALVQLLRDKDIVNGQGQVVWRIELWYFEEEFGGWAKVAQQNRVIHRERFKTHAAYEAARASWKWMAALGGLRAAASAPENTVVVTGLD